MSSHRVPPATLLLPVWRQCARAALDVERLVEGAGTDHLLRILEQLGHRAGQVAVIVWVDEILAANGIIPTTSAAAEVTLRPVDDTSAEQPVHRWLQRLVEARATGNHQRTSRIMREAEIDPSLWRECVAETLRTAGHTIRQQQLAKVLA